MLICTVAYRQTELCQAIAVLARAHQDAIWARTKAHNQLRSLLREFYPTFLATFSQFALGIASAEARAVLAIAPAPAAAAKLSLSRTAAALRRAGRSRNITTRASGRSLSITHRHIKNNRLANVGWMWAFTAATNCEPARRHYRQRREHGDRHGAATRHLFNKLLGQLHYCLQHRELFNEDKAFGHGITMTAA